MGATLTRSPMSRSQLWMIALNWGNAGNRQRMRDGRGWSDAQLDAVVNTLSAAEWDAVQAVWDHIDSYWPQISATSFSPGFSIMNALSTPSSQPNPRVPRSGLPVQNSC